VQGREAWGAERGAEAYGRINIRLRSLSEGTLIVLDYSGLDRSDVSFQREAVVETIRKHRPRLLFVAANLMDADLRANVDHALERQGESLLVREANGAHEVIGKPLTKEHGATLQAVSGHGEFTSGMLTSKPFGLESSTASARLTMLWRAGLIGRIQGAAPSGGREYKYFAIR
jgi:hypothetical protein